MPRCQRVSELCRTDPPLVGDAQHGALCHHPLEVVA
jgi:hypothetical protein